jgi:bifunctional NMN adenylyltransferase/nudix hydrolase
MSEFDAVVVAARFQPLHAGHLAAIHAARARAPRVLVVVLGADCAPTLKTPWSTAERLAALADALPACPAIDILTVRDVPYDVARWSRALDAAVGALLPSSTRIALVADPAPAGLWPRRWIRTTRDAGFAAGEAALRDELLWGPETEWARLEPRLPLSQTDALRRWHDGPQGLRLRDEAAFIRAFRARWASAPYPPVFVTVDAVVVWRGELLLIQRGRAPGRDLWALPGGFLDQHETLEAAARREVAEETGLELAVASAVSTRVFDEPGRSLRGRTLTHAFHFALDDARPRPLVEGADDARAAAWFPCTALAPETLFEDHYAILQVVLDLP